MCGGGGARGKERFGATSQNDGIDDAIGACSQMRERAVVVGVGGGSRLGSSKMHPVSSPRTRRLAKSKTMDKPPLISSPFLKDLIAGTAGGVAGIIAGQPLDRVKVMRQLGLGSSSWQISRNIVREQGFRGFYRGVLAPIAANAPINATAFSTYNFTMRVFSDRRVKLEGGRCRGGSGSRSNSGKNGEPRQRELSLVDRAVLMPQLDVLCAGSLAGAAQSVFTAPAELIKCQLQAQTGANAGKASVSGIVSFPLG